MKASGSEAAPGSAAVGRQPAAGRGEIERQNPAAVGGIRGALAATSLCADIAFLCSEAHLDAWRRTTHPGAEGFRLAPDEAMRAGRAPFSPALRPAAGAVGRAV
ncbi:MAG: hypothetical protein HY521_05725 [Proteobacteria bacterium]|nr:hypothetical protein [Pseudomonadota bacterium]